MPSDSIRGNDNNNNVVESYRDKPRSEGSSSNTLCGSIFTDHDVEQIILFSKKATAHLDNQIFKFDVLHGDSRRRCPICDKAIIFQFPSVDSSLHTSSTTHDIEKQEELPEENTSLSMQSVSSKEEKQNTPITHIVNCLECGTEFCSFHSNAHTGRTCQDYENELQQTDKKSADYLRHHAKCCPQCGINIEKIDGCNRMQCPICHTSAGYALQSLMKAVCTSKGGISLVPMNEQVHLIRRLDTCFPY